MCGRPGRAEPESELQGLGMGAGRPESDGQAGRGAEPDRIRRRRRVDHCAGRLRPHAVAGDQGRGPFQTTRHVTLLLGTLVGMASSVVAYRVGSSSGSMQKNAALEEALAQK